MSPVSDAFDFVILGAGPAGQKAALAAAQAGCSTLLLDRNAQVGGECVHRGTIPSKTLRESAVYFSGLRRRASDIVGTQLGPHTLVRNLMQRLEQVEHANEGYLRRQLESSGVTLWQGRGRFASPHEIDVTLVSGGTRRVRAEHVVLATGSRPRAPADVPVDHENVLDSDSILSLIYLPSSLVVLGAGVIASEFATIFQSLGTRVTMVDKGPRPLGFLDPEIADAFVARFEAAGGRFLGGTKHRSVAFDGVSSCLVTLENGEMLHADKVFVALGRTASVAGLNLEAAGLVVNERGVLPVDADCRTQVAHIFAAGDVIGPPALAASSMEQGRRAVRAALGQALGSPASSIPAGIYTIPEIATVGISEAEARAKHGGCIVGRARFDEIARGHINGETEGLLKLVCDPTGTQLLGASILGEGATELIHLAQLVLVGNARVDAFVENVFNFPTFAEAYRVAALDAASQRARLRAVG